MVYWYNGILVYWCIGVLVYWCTGVLVYWCTGVLVYWCIGIFRGRSVLINNLLDVDILLSISKLLTDFTL